MTGASTAPAWAVAETRPGYGNNTGYGNNGWQGAGPGGQQDHARRNVIFVMTAAGVAIAGVVGAVIWTLGQSPQSTPNGGSAPNSTFASGQSLPSGGQGGQNVGGGQTPPRTPTAAATTAPAGPADLLTPSGMTALVANVKSVMGTTKVTELDVYPDHADGDVILASNHTLYDDFDYSNGQGADSGPGGTLDSDDKTVDLSVFNWNALPALLATAQQELKVNGTPMIYIIIDPDWENNSPTIRVYVTDAYDGGGYITANAKGDVTGKYE